MSKSVRIFPDAFSYASGFDPIIMRKLIRDKPHGEIKEGLYWGINDQTILYKAILAIYVAARKKSWGRNDE